MKSISSRVSRSAGVAAAIVLSFGAGQALAEQANYVGGGLMHDFNPSCVWENRPHPFSVRLNTPDLSDPQSSITLTFLARHYVMSYQLNSGRFTNDFQGVRATTLYGTQDQHRARIRLQGGLPDLSSQDPIRLRGVIRNMDGLGCNVKFDAVVARGPAAS